MRQEVYAVIAILAFVTMTAFIESDSMRWVSFLALAVLGGCVVLGKLTKKVVRISDLEKRANRKARKIWR